MYTAALLAPSPQFRFCSTQCSTFWSTLRTSFLVPQIWTKRHYNNSKLRWTCAQSHIITRRPRLMHVPRATPAIADIHDELKYRLIGISSIFRDKQTDMDLCETPATAEYYRVPWGTLLKFIWRRHHLYKKIRSILLEVPVWTHLTHKLHHSMCKINASHTNFSARLSIANFGSLRN